MTLRVVPEAIIDPEAISAPANAILRIVPRDCCAPSGGSKNPSELSAIESVRPFLLTQQNQLFPKVIVRSRGEFNEPKKAFRRRGG